MNPQSATELLQSLIQIPSINPEGISEAALASGHYGELPLAQALQPFLEESGFDVTLEEVRPGRPNIIARAPGPQDRPRILFGPHLDTVGVETMTIPPFEAQISEGKIWGRGASDTKGTMASMLWGLKQNAALLASAPVAIDFVGFMGEETQQLGAKHFAENHANKYEFAIAGEPTSLQIVNCTKGCLWATLSAKGLAVHASQPERGSNAILNLFAHFQELMEEMNAKFSSASHPILGQSTWNLGTFAGGTSPNVVADYAELDIDIRTIPELWTEGGAGKFLEALCAEREIELLYRPENPPMEVNADNQWIAAIQDIHPDSRCVGAPWFSDASHLNAANLPSVCLGPGNIAQAHTEDEFITVEDLEGGGAYFQKLVEALCKNA